MNVQLPLGSATTVPIGVAVPAWVMVTEPRASAVPANCTGTTGVEPLTGEVMAGVVAAVSTVTINGAEATLVTELRLTVAVKV